MSITVLNCVVVADLVRVRKTSLTGALFSADLDLFGENYKISSSVSVWSVIDELHSLIFGHVK